MEGKAITWSSGIFGLEGFSPAILIKCDASIRLLKPCSSIICLHNMPRTLRLSPGFAVRLFLKQISIGCPLGDPLFEPLGPLGCPLGPLNGLFGGPLGGPLRNPLGGPLGGKVSCMGKLLFFTGPQG